MKIGKFKSKVIRVSNSYLRVKPTTLAKWMKVSLATIYRHIGQVNCYPLVYASCPQDTSVIANYR